MQKKYVFSVILFLYVCMMLFSFVSPLVAQVNIPTGMDKIAHLGEFFILAFLVLRTLQLYGFTSRYLLAFLALAVFGFLTEYVQLYIPGRSYGMLDYAADIAGILFGFMLYWFVEWNSSEV